jgi:hypothetical protein
MRYHLSILLKINNNQIIMYRIQTQDKFVIHNMKTMHILININLLRQLVSYQTLYIAKNQINYFEY